MRKSLFAFLGMIICAFGVKAQSNHIQKGVYKAFPKMYRSKDSLVRFIQPDKDYTYWEFADGEFSKSKSGRLIFSKGIKPAGLTLNDPGNGDEDMINGCRPGACYKYIAYVRNDTIGYVTTRSQLVNFIGTIDNLAEAVLLAESSVPKRQYLGVDANHKGGSYNIKANGPYDFILTNNIECPSVKEAIHISVNKQGEIKKTTLGIFHKEKAAPLFNARQ